MTEAERSARYACWLDITSKCAKCGATKESGAVIALYYKDGAKCTAMASWGWKVETQRSKLEGLCRACRPTKEESDARKAQYVAREKGQEVLPGRDASDDAKLEWFGNAYAKLCINIVGVFGEPLTVADLVQRNKARRQALRDAASQASTPKP